MRRNFYKRITPTPEERAQTLLGDDLIPHANTIMDRAFSVPGKPEEVWPWFLQLGKNRAGWYFPASIERFIPRNRRGLRNLNEAYQHYQVGDRIDDWGGKHGYFDVAMLIPTTAIVYTSSRGRLTMSWAITLKSEGSGTRVLIRLRAETSGKKLFEPLGDLLDKLTILGLASGLQERLESLSRV